MIIAEKSTFLELGSEFYRNPFVSSSIRASGHSLKATSRQFVFQFFCLFSLGFLIFSLAYFLFSVCSSFFVFLAFFSFLVF